MTEVPTGKAHKTGCAKTEVRGSVAGRATSEPLSPGSQEPIMIICGYRIFVRRLAMLVAICERCEERAVLQIDRQIKRLVLLMIPVFPRGSWYYSRCAACGGKYPLRKAAAKELAVRARRQAR